MSAALSFAHLEQRLRHICAEPPKVLLISAPAGYGKSVLLRHFAEQAGPHWQTMDAPETLTGWDRDRPLALCCRPEDIPVELDAMRLYGDVADIGAQDLLIPKDRMSAAQWARSQGWPVLMRPAAWDVEDDLLIRFMAKDALAVFPVDQLLSFLTPEGWSDQLLDCLPPLRAPRTSGGRRLSRLLAEAVESAMLMRLEANGAPRADIDPLRGQHALNLRLLKRALQDGRIELAQQLFERFGGWYLFYDIGPDAFTELVSLFSEHPEARSDELVLARCILAIKQGEIATCRHILGSHFDPQLLDIFHCLSEDCPWPIRVRVFRVVLHIYEDAHLSDRMTLAVQNFVSQLPLEEHVLRGSCYNFLLDLFIRSRRYDQAHDAARRAEKAYGQAGIPLLSFYIALHRSVLFLLRGEIGAADMQLQSAEKWINKVAFESHGDIRFLALIRSVLAFETGETGPLLDFVKNDLDAFEEGEVWPALAEITIQFGALALGSEYNARTALDFLDHWAQTKAHSRSATFRALIDVRRARTLQNANRWGEAAQVLAALRMRFDRVWIESAQGELKHLTTRDEIAIALCWLRQIAFEHPAFPFLLPKLAEMRLNPGLSGRQSLAIDIWRAYVARHLRDETLARSLLQSVFERIAHQQAFSSMHEEHLFLDELLGDQRLSRFLKATPAIRAVLRRRDALQGGYALSSARKLLTRQEFKVLALLTEGASNKSIARRLDVSEPTVKFHLKNLYRKLGCRRRSEAVETARAFGWV